MSDGSTGRRQRERDYHDHRYAADTRARADRFYSDESADRARYTQLVSEQPPGAHILEYGCGTGSSAFVLAEQGATVVGIDISEVAVRKATAQAAGSSAAQRLSFAVMDAEHLGFPDRSFDMVCGSGILHHLDTDAGLSEVARVLRPGGRGIFLEPLGHNPLVRLYRRLTPSMRTPDEHPLLRTDLEAMRSRFPAVDVEYFHLLDLLALPAQRTTMGRRAVHRLARLDRSLLDRFPRLGPYAWTTVVQVSTSPR